MARKPATPTPARWVPSWKSSGSTSPPTWLGFDLPEGKARAQLQCLAKTTGGRYVEARDAAELNKALGQLAQAAPVAAPPKPIDNLKPPKGCMLYCARQLQGRAACRWANLATPTKCHAGWDKRVRSLKCSARSSLYLYNDKGREGDYVMTETGR